MESTEEETNLAWVGTVGYQGASHRVVYVKLAITYKGKDRRVPSPKDVVVKVVER